MRNGAPGQVRHTPSTWGAGRWALATLALATAILTGAASGALGGSALHAYGAAAYVVATGAALFVRRAIVFQVALGQLLAGVLILSPAGPAPPLLLPLVASVVLTAELLAVVARMDTPAAPVPTGDLRRAVQAAFSGAVVFAVVLPFAALPGPSGVAAVGLAAAGCVVLASVLARRAEA